MEEIKALQKYFSILSENGYRSTINESLSEPFISLVNDIGLLLETDLLKKDSTKFIGHKEYAFKVIEIKNENDQIDCYLSVTNITDGEHYINLANKIAHFFNSKFPFSVKELNIGSPIRNELMKGYELKGKNQKLLYSAGIYLSNDICKIRFTIIR